MSKMVELGYELLERVNILAVVARTVDGSLGDEGGMGEAKIVEQDPEGLRPDCSLSDLLMAVKLRSAGCLGVITVDDFYVVQSDGCVQLLEGLVDALFRDNVVSGNVGVTGIDAGGDGHDAAKAVDDFGDLLEAASEGVFGTRSIFDKDGESGGCEVEIPGGGGDGGCRL